MMALGWLTVSLLALLGMMERVPTTVVIKRFVTSKCLTYFWFLFMNRSFVLTVVADEP